MSRRVWNLAALGLALVGGGLGASQGGLVDGLVGLTVGGLVAVVAGWAEAAVRQRSGTAHLVAAGLLTLFLGERMLATGTERAVVSGMGVAIVLAGLGVRAYAMQGAGDRLREAHRLALIAGASIAAGLLLYGATLDPIGGALFDDAEGRARWDVTLGALWPIAIAAGLLPMASIDRLLALHPRRLPPRAASTAATQALSAALAIALVFPVNYLASRHAWTSDTAYFRTTDAGSSTLAIARTLPEPVDAYLFFPAGSDVGKQVAPYFDALAAASDGRLRVKRIDQALAPTLAEELQVRNNGVIVLQMGESRETFRVGDEMSRARRNLKKLDENIQKLLMKVTRGQRQAYFVVGHGEANFREREDQLRKLNLFKKALESQNYKVGNLGPAEGLANAVPDDADLVVVAAPQRPMLPEAVESLTTYLDQGGALLVLAEPAGDPMTDLLAPIGVRLGDGLLAHAQAHVRQTRGPADRVLLATNRFGSHAAVSTLSKNGTTLSMVMPEATAIDRLDVDGDGEARVNTLVRSFPDTWIDADGDRRRGDAEVSGVFDLAVAATGPDRGDAGPAWRAIVVGDATWASDPVLQFSQGNQVFLLDGVRWLVGDEDLAGEVASEEDVRIEHTRSEDWVWFFLTVLAVPLLVFGVGFTTIRMREKGA